MGVKASIEEKRKLGETIPQSKEDIYRGGQIKDQSFAEITNNGGKNRIQSGWILAIVYQKGILGC